MTTRIPSGLFPLLMCVTIASCSLFEEKKSESPSPAVHRIDIDPASVARSIESLLRDTTDARFARTEHLAFADTLCNFYAERSYRPLFIFEQFSLADAECFTRYLSRADEHGLDRRWYHVDRIERLADELKSSAALSQDWYRAYARIDVLLADGILRYVKHLQFGVVDPRTFDPDQFFLPLKEASGYDVLTPLKVDDLSSYLDSVQPTSSPYRLLQHALRVLTLMHDSPSRSLPAVPNKIVPGQRTDLAPQLRDAALRNRNPFVVHASWTAAFPYRLWKAMPMLDVFLLHRDSIDAGWYDSSLKRLIVNFQRDNALFDDGVVGQKTIDVLNLTRSDRIMQIRLNLERLRWFGYPQDEEYVRINIPDYRLFAYDSGMRKISMKVCVGERFRGWWIHGHIPMNYQTPLLHGKITYIILNPVWNVPSSIATRETYYQAKKDPTFLLRHNYRVYIKDSLINAANINWSSYNADHLPFRFVQGAGRGNALGRIKFMFYNPFDVYLHDTPKRVPFTRAMRAVSHGCVRVEEPMTLVRYFLQNHSSWNADKVRAYLNQTQEGKVIFLDRKVPIYLDYITAWVDSDGRLQFRDDVYNKDRLLKNVLGKIQ